MRGSNSSIREMARIFWTFLKISPMTFGGGYAMIPMIEREVVGKRQWIDETEMAEVLSVAGSAPGGIGVNASAFIGYRRAGIGGAAAAVLGITLPTFIIAFTICVAFSQIEHYVKARAALQGIHAGIAALITAAACNMWRSSVVDKPTLAAVVGTVLVLLLLNIHPIWIIVSGLLVGHVIVYTKSLLGIGTRFEDNGQRTEAATGYKYADYFIADGI